MCLWILRRHRAESTCSLVLSDGQDQPHSYCTVSQSASAPRRMRPRSPSTEPQYGTPVWNPSTEPQYGTPTEKRSSRFLPCRTLPPVATVVHLRGWLLRRLLVGRRQPHIAPLAHERRVLATSPCRTTHLHAKAEVPVVPLSGRARRKRPARHQSRGRWKDGSRCCWRTLSRWRLLTTVCAMQRSADLAAGHNTLIRSTLYANDLARAAQGPEGKRGDDWGSTSPASRQDR
jgi:hypothetical protein